MPWRRAGRLLLQRQVWSSCFRYKVCSLGLALWALCRGLLIVRIGLGKLWGTEYDLMETLRKRYYSRNYSGFTSGGLKGAAKGESGTSGQ